MPQIQLDEYYGLSADNFDDAKQLIRAIEDELPEEGRTHRAIRTCLDTNEFDDAIAFMALAMGAKEGDVLSDVVQSFHERHRVRNELNGICDAAQCLTKNSPTRQKVMDIMERCKQLSYKDWPIK